MSGLAVCPPDRIAAVWLFSFVLIFCGAVCGPALRAAWNYRLVLHHVHLADAAKVGALLFNPSIGSAHVQLRAQPGTAS
jgi:hypothetical protein